MTSLLLNSHISFLHCKIFTISFCLVDSVLFASKQTGENPTVKMVHPTTDHYVHWIINNARSGKDPHRRRSPQIGDGARQKVHKLYRIQQLQNHIPTIRRAFLHNCRRRSRQRTFLLRNNPFVRGTSRRLFFQRL